MCGHEQRIVVDTVLGAHGALAVLALALHAFPPVVDRHRVGAVVQAFVEQDDVDAVRGAGVVTVGVLVVALDQRVGNVEMVFAS